MPRKETNKGGREKNRPRPTVKHESSAESAQDISASSLLHTKKEKPDAASGRRHSGSDGTANEGRGSNH